jgi:hypothetical protein
MIVKAIYKINNEYVIGDDKNVYRLPFQTIRRSLGLRKLKQHRGGYFINGIWQEKKDIEYISIEPYELINDEGLPF